MYGQKVALMMQMVEHDTKAPMEKRNTQRAIRGHMSFMNRMETDVRQKQFQKMTNDLRKDPAFEVVSKQTKLRQQQQRALTPNPEDGPRVVVHQVKKEFEGHSRKLQWGPLDCM